MTHTDLDESVWMRVFRGSGRAFCRSTANAQHLADKLVSRFHYDRLGMAGLASLINTSMLTVWRGGRAVRRRDLRSHGMHATRFVKAPRRQAPDLRFDGDGHAPGPTADKMRGRVWVRP
jgi:hypothetical protein